MKARLILSVLLPFPALVVQWMLWDWISPFVWFLFFPTVFFSARLGGLTGGMASAALSATMVWFFFIPPQLSWKADNPPAVYSVLLFLVMGYLFSDSQERLRRSQEKTDSALAEARAARDEITVLYHKTLELEKLKNEFFATISHELRTPLTLIMSPLSQRLAAQTAGTEALRQQDEMMLRNARLLYRHVSDLLDVAKLEAGRMTVDYGRINLGSLIRAVATQFNSLAQEKSLLYGIDVPEAFEAEVDGEKVQRILLNLLSNAFKFTPGGGRIDVRLREDSGQALLEVQDDGPGIPASMREAIFERFRQVEGGSQRSHGGTGLGLAIVKNFAELQGGSARAVEAPGGGALFTVTLPLKAPAGTEMRSTNGLLDSDIEYQAIEELQSEKRGARSWAGAGAGANAPLVLVVEDNADMNEFISATLRPHYRVENAFDGVEGLEKADAWHPDLILSDVMMPGMSGDEMVKELRRRPGMNNVPIIVLTAKTDDALRVNLFEQGVQGYLNKPFSTEELLARVRGLVASRRRTLEDLMRSEAELNEAQRLAQVGSWTWDSRSDTTSWSAEMYRIFGLDPSRRPPSLTENADQFSPESWTKVIAARKKALAEGLSYECEAEATRPDGNSRLVVSRGEAIFDGDGLVTGVHGTVQDITERLKASEEIRRLNMELEQRVITRTAELSAANHELESFAYAVSHDLRAPLRAMNGFAQALVEDYGDRFEGKAKAYLDQIGLASQSMGKLIDGILTLSRSIRGDLKRDNIDISALAVRLLEEMARNEPDRNVDWQVEPGLRGTADPVMIEVVLRNLLGNAWKYTGKTTAPVITVSSGEIDGRSGYRIDDNGAGFDMAHAAQLFLPFRRLHRQDEFPGIGIGLATVSRIVQRHGGEIRAEGRPGKGATFYFTLPPATAEVSKPL